MVKAISDQDQTQSVVKVPQPSTVFQINNSKTK